MISTTLNFEGGIYRAGSRTQVGDEIDLWQPYADEDYGDIVGFSILLNITYRVGSTKINKFEIKYKFYAIKFKGIYEREEVQKYVQGRSNFFKTKSPTSMISTTLNFEGGIYRAGSRTQVGDEIDLWQPYDR